MPIMIHSNVDTCINERFDHEIIDFFQWTGFYMITASVMKGLCK